MRALGPMGPPLLLALLAAACAPADPDAYDPGDDVADTSGRLPTRVRVGGKVVDIESDYLPKVVQCENPDAPFESLKAQAIAARTFLFHAVQGRKLPTISNGQADQVYTCGRNHFGRMVPDLVQRAVRETRDLYATYNGRITSGNYVSGAYRDAQCRRGSDPTGTERFVTLNNNKRGSQVAPSAIGNRSNPDNRGCMGQLLANCIADTDGLSGTQIVKYFYGADIVIHGVTDGEQSQQPYAGTDDPGPVMSTGDHRCHSDSLGADVALGACVLSGYDHAWHQCLADGTWADAQDGAGAAGACTARYDGSATPS
jgi:hypothetical protein